MTKNLPYTIARFGTEKQPVVIIDDFIDDPHALVARATNKQFTKRGLYYPGMRTQADPNYLSETSSILTTILKSVFGIEQGAKLVECNFSLVTTLPENLLPIQCLPHFDGLDAGRIAILHYLCQPADGGTAFYRHKETGYETITTQRFKQYEACLNQGAVQYGLPPKQYFTSNTQQFERIGDVGALFNRCLIYRGITLHSGDIPDGLKFDTDPSTGRLTVNTFLAAN